MKEFTKEMLGKLMEANNSMKGTNNYTKYHMENEAKSENGRWFFIGHSIPYQTGIIKSFKESTYIITESSSCKARYRVTDEVKNLLGI